MRKRAVIVVAEDSTVITRVKRRETREGWSPLAYDRSKFLAAYSKWPPAALYEAWREELRLREIPFIEVDSETHTLLEPPAGEPGER